MKELLAPLLEWLAWLGQSASGVLDVVESVDPVLRVTLAGLAAVLEMFVITGLLVPGDTVVLFAASVVGTPGEGIVLGVVIAVGALLGETASYALGRWRHRTRETRAQHGVGDQKVSSARRFLARRGGPAILAARFIPVLRTVLPFAAGLVGFPFSRFLAWSIPASLLWSVTYVTIYSLAGASLRDDPGSPLVTVGVATVGFMLFGSALGAQVLVERAHAQPVEEQEPN